MNQSLFGCTLLNGFKYSKWLNNSIWPTNETLTGIINMGRSGPGSNGNEEIFLIPQSSIAGASLSDIV